MGGEHVVLQLFHGCVYLLREREILADVRASVALGCGSAGTKREHGEQQNDSAHVSSGVCKWHFNRDTPLMSKFIQIFVLRGAMKNLIALDWAAGGGNLSPVQRFSARPMSRPRCRRTASKADTKKRD
jgi:hypothetical protein